MIFRVQFIPIMLYAPPRLVAAGLVSGYTIVMLEVWR